MRYFFLSKYDEKSYKNMLFIGGSPSEMALKKTAEERAGHRLQWKREDRLLYSKDGMYFIEEKEV